MKIKNSWDNFLLSIDKYTINDRPLREFAAKTSYFLLMLIIIPLLFSSGDSIRYTDVKIGSVATKRVVAPFNFFILKTDTELNADREQAKKKVPYYFKYNRDITKQQISTLDKSLEFIQQSHVSKYDTLNPTAFI